MKSWIPGPLVATVITALFTLPGCSSGESAEATGEVATFVNQVWAVAESEQIAIGELRVFLAEGTLVMASSHGSPAFGTWEYRDGQLTIVEESLEYEVDILELSRDTFRIRIHSPGEPVEIRFEPAAQPSFSGISRQPPDDR